eukprot:4027571-Pyramimonas_sp.AAC.1
MAPPEGAALLAIASPMSDWKIIIASISFWRDFAEFSMLSTEAAFFARSSATMRRARNNAVSDARIRLGWGQNGYGSRAFLRPPLCPPA